VVLMPLSIGGMNELTKLPVVIPQPTQVEPEFLPLPPPGKVCPYSGLKRGSFYALIHEGAIESIVLRRKGAARGRRLIVFATLRDYLSKLRAEQCGARIENVR
jgi:hypothetical protein